MSGTTQGCTPDESKKPLSITEIRDLILDVNGHLQIALEKALQARSALESHRGDTRVPEIQEILDRVASVIDGLENSDSACNINADAIDGIRRILGE